MKEAEGAGAKIGVAFRWTRQENKDDTEVYRHFKWHILPQVGSR